MTAHYQALLMQVMQAEGVTALPCQKLAMAGELSPDLLIVLSADPSPLARIAAAAAPAIPLPALTRLLNDPEPIVRSLLAANPAVPRVALRALVEDDDPTVAALARKHRTP